MIQFRCWYCNKHLTRPESAVGERFTCSCAHRLRVPRRNFGNSRAKTGLDWLIEGVVYGGGGAELGGGLGVVLVAALARMYLFRLGIFLIPLLTLAGFLVGLFGGERGINWLGRMIRGNEG
jgi:hypothetical protein